MVQDGVRGLIAQLAFPHLLPHLLLFDVLEPERLRADNDHVLVVLGKLEPVQGPVFLWVSIVNVSSPPARRGLDIFLNLSLSASVRLPVPF